MLVLSCRCEHCLSHFLEMYENCENGRCVITKPSKMRGQQTSISTGEPALALWVWRMHNAVNARNAVEADPPQEPHRYDNKIAKKRYINKIR